MEITKWEYIDLNGYVRSKQDPGRFFESDRDPEGYSRKSKTEILNELGKKGWEVVGVYVSGGGGSIDSNFFLKRPCGRLQVIEKVNGVPINDDKN